MSPDLVLYRKNGACSFVPHAILNDLAIPFAPVLLDFTEGGMAAADGSFTNAEYKKIHPRGFVPALKIDGQIITELPAIVGYIADLKPKRQLMGSTPSERAKVNEWLAWLSGTLHGSGFGMLWRSNRFTDSDNPVVHEAIREKGRSTILYCCERIEETLEGKHAVGGRFTVVDIALYNFYRWTAMRFGLKENEMEEKFPRYTELARHVEKMESVKKTLHAESQPLAFPE